MKIILIVFCLAAVLLVLVTACSNRQANDAGVSEQGGTGQSQDVTALNYDEMILLDAEDLGEGSVGETYRNSILPVVAKHVPAPAEIVEQLDSPGGTYKVMSQGKTYVIFSPGMDLDAGQNWGNATFAIFDIVNRQLQNSP